MILTLGWIGIALLLCLFYLWIGGTLAQRKELATIMLAFAVLFIGIDYMTSELYTEIEQVGIEKTEVEHCDITAISHDCTRNTTYSYDMDNPIVQRYVAFRNAQDSAIQAITPAAGLLMVLGIVYLLWGWLREWGYVK